MNIIKLKDTIMPGDSFDAYIFNKYLKGKYAYWVQMRYIVPMGLYMDKTFNIPVGMKHEGYVACEEDITKLLQKPDATFPKPYGSPCLDVYNYFSYVDSKETDKVNSIKEYKMQNNYAPDSDITIDEVKKFRTWLASTLLYMDQYEENNAQKYDSINEQETHILQYYSNNMYDNTIKILSEFGQTQTNMITITDKACGCCGSNNLSSLYNTELDVCDPISIYRRNIYLKMIEMFSDINFWLRWAKIFISEFKHYISNIIKLDLPLTGSEYVVKFNECGCVDDDAQKNMVVVLQNLYKSLTYIENDDIVGHKNFIKDSLYNWSSLLYEKMQW